MFVIMNLIYIAIKSSHLVVPLVFCRKKTSARLVKEGILIIKVRSREVKEVRARCPLCIAQNKGFFFFFFCLIN